jgi:hypothetical protein
MPAVLAIAIGIWWNANTVSHIFIHRPFFRGRTARAWAAAGLTALLGFPQSVWRDRHLAHHAQRAYRFRLSREVMLQAAVIVTLWTILAVYAPLFFTTAYLPGYAGGLLLCAVHGYFEHATGTTSHYGRVYNMLCFNDGYHVEHHRYPSRPWTDLPACRVPSARASAWPAPLRWLEIVNLETLERIVLRSALLQRVVLRQHARALAPLVAALPAAPRIAIVGGGLFPRTALILRRLVPDARLTIVDASRANLDRAAALLQEKRVSLVHGHWEGNAVLSAGCCVLGARDGVLSAAVPLLSCSWDLVVFPLSFDGDREAIYSHPPAPAVIVHDWIWRRRGTSRVVSVALLKRVNMVRLKPDTTYEESARGVRL